MKQTAGEKTVNRLIDEGWTVSHTATVNRYIFAGSVTPMKSRDGYDYCRVHHGRCVGSHSYQITTVMMRKQSATD